MDWLILIVFVPVLLVAIAALCGFAGCGIDFVATGVRPAPTDLVATATGPHSIKVTWRDHRGDATTFDVAHAKLGEAAFTTAVTGVVSVRENTDDLNLDDATTYLYHLIEFDAVVADGGTATTLPEAPAILEAIGTNVDRIKIRWKNKSGKADRFTLQHRSPPATGLFTTIFEGGATEFSHKVPETGQLGGPAHEYQVIATVAGFDKNVSKLVQSAPSVAAIASPLAWKIGYDHHPVTDVRIEDFRDACVVQRIKSANLANGGVQVRITLEGAKTGSIAIEKMSISQGKVQFAPNTIENEWDSEGTPTQVPLVGSPPATPLPLVPGGILLAANTSIVLNATVYDLDRTKDLIVAFDIGSAAGTSAFAVVAGSKPFFRSNTKEALLADRSSAAPPYQPGTADRVYLVTQIDVLG